MGCGALMFSWLSGPGDRIVFERPYYLRELSGLGGAPVDIREQRSTGQDGATPLEQQLLPRDIIVELMVVGPDPGYLRRRRRDLAWALNPKLGTGTLTWERDGQGFEVRAVPEESPTFIDSLETGSRAVRAIIHLRASDPFWYTAEMVSPLLTLEGGLNFPMVLCTEFAERSPGSTAVIDNPGDVPAPVVLRFWGPATAPITISNETTDEHVQVVTDLSPDEVLVVDTNPGRKSIVVESEEGETGAMHYVSLDTVFWHFETGENTIVFDTGGVGEVAEAEIRWRPRYVGV